MDSAKRYMLWRMTGVCSVALLLLIAYVWAKRHTPTTVPCSAIEYVFSDESERMYVESGELDRLLQDEHLYPVGKPVAQIRLHSMEQTICDHEMIRHAECYLTPRQVLKVKLSQRKPLLRVANTGNSYFVDTDRKKMPVRASIKDSVLIVKGAVSEEVACAGLADFASWLRGNRYWHERIDCVEVKSSDMIYIYLRGLHQPRIVLGKLENYSVKLAKLRTFFEGGEEATKDKQYTELDLRFKDQVVGRK